MESETKLIPASKAAESALDTIIKSINNLIEKASEQGKTRIVLQSANYEMYLGSDRLKTRLNNAGYYLTWTDEGQTSLMVSWAHLTK